MHAREHKGKSAETTRPRPQRKSARPPSRHVPAALRRAVWKRDGGRCSYRSPNGRRCGAREFLEIDHAEPWGRVRAHALENLRLRCRTHNQYTASLAFGEAHMARFRKDGARARADSEGGRERRTRSGTSCVPRTRSLHAESCSMSNEKEQEGQAEGGGRREG